MAVVVLLSSSRAGCAWLVEAAGWCRLDMGYSLLERALAARGAESESAVLAGPHAGATACPRSVSMNQRQEHGSTSRDDVVLLRVEKKREDSGRHCGMSTPSIRLFTDTTLGRTPRSPTSSILSAPSTGRRCLLRSRHSVAATETGLTR